MKKLLIILVMAVLGTGCAAPRERGVVPTVYDSIEQTNRGIYYFNENVFDYIHYPITSAYNYIVPGFVRLRLYRFFDNLSELGTIVNSVLQLKLSNAAATTGRFIVNSTIGIGGLFDVATDMGLTRDRERFNNVLATYGVAEGPMVTIPLMIPVSTRTAVGFVGDFFLDPLYFIIPRTIGRDVTEYYVYAGLNGLVVTSVAAEYMDQVRASNPDSYDTIITYSRMAEYAHLDGLEITDMRPEQVKTE